MQGGTTPSAEGALLRYGVEWLTKQGCYAATPSKGFFYSVKKKISVALSESNFLGGGLVKRASKGRDGLTWPPSALQGWGGTSEEKKQETKSERIFIRVLKLVDRTSLSFVDASRRGSTPLSDIFELSILLKRIIFVFRSFLLLRLSRGFILYKILLQIYIIIR